MILLLNFEKKKEKKFVKIDEIQSWLGKMYHRQMYVTNWVTD